MTIDKKGHGCEGEVGGADEEKKKKKTESVHSQIMRSLAGLGEEDSGVYSVYNIK